MVFYQSIEWTVQWVLSRTHLIVGHRKYCPYLLEGIAVPPNDEDNYGGICSSLYRVKCLKEVTSPPRFFQPQAFWVRAQAMRWWALRPMLGYKTPAAWSWSLWAAKVSCRAEVPDLWKPTCRISSLGMFLVFQRATEGLVVQWPTFELIVGASA